MNNPILYNLSAHLKTCIIPEFHQASLITALDVSKSDHYLRALLESALDVMHRRLLAGAGVRDVCLRHRLYTFKGRERTDLIVTMVTERTPNCLLASSPQYMVCNARF